MKKNKHAGKGISFWKEFKTFITRGNVMDMAIGVVIGASFSKIVTGMVNMIINPFVGIFLKHGSLDNLKTVIVDEVKNAAGEVVTAEVAILWGSWLQTILDFLITAFFVFLFSKIIMGLRRRIEAEKIAAEEKAKKEAEEKAAAEKAAADAAAAALAEAKAERDRMFRESIMMQEKLLTDIRDLLEKK